MTLAETIKAVQRKIGVKDDGVDGPITWNALAKFLGVVDERLTPNPAKEGGAVDERSEKNIATLLLPAQLLARQFLIALNANFNRAGQVAKIISGTRSYEEQDALYAKGRTGGGRIVTNARGGYSNHNFGLAFDIGIFDGGQYLDESPLYDLAGEVGKSLGLDWGGDWKSIQDKPHFEWRPSWAADLSENALLSELRARKAKGQAIT